MRYVRTRGSRRAPGLYALVSAALLVVASPAAAQWTPTPAPSSLGITANMQLLNVNDAKVSSFTTTDGYRVYIGPYSGALTSDLSHPFTIYCVDFLHSISINQVWSANVSQLVSGGIGNTRLSLSGAADALTRYKKAAWLASQFASVTQNSEQWSALHGAIWQFVNPGADFPSYVNWDNSTVANDYNAFVTSANNAFGAGDPTGFNFGSWRVITDQSVTSGGTGGTQEFIAQVTTVTPEPETYALLGVGLLAIFFVAYRRREQALG